MVVEPARDRASAAASTLAWAAVTSSCTAEPSIRASTWPGVTWSPGFTATSVTVPAVLKLRPRVWAGVTVPAADAVSVTAPRWTRTVFDATGVGAGRAAYAYVPRPTTATASAPRTSRNRMARSLARPAGRNLKSGRFPSGLRGWPDVTPSRPGFHERVRNRVRGAIVLLVLVAAAGVVAACASKAPTRPSPGAAPAGFQAYTDCLRQHGVIMASRAPRTARPSPGTSRRAGGFGDQPPPGVDTATWEKAQQACASVRPSAGPRGGGTGGNGAATAYRNCLADHGVTMGQFNSADPRTAAALATCAPLRPTGRPVRPRSTPS